MAKPEMAVSEPSPKSAHNSASQSSAFSADAASIGAARSSLAAENGDARPPRAQAEAVGVWRGAARVSGEAPDASGVVREPLLPLGGLSAKFSDKDAVPANDAVKSINTRAVEGTDQAAKADGLNVAKPKPETATAMADEKKKLQGAVAPAAGRSEKSTDDAAASPSTRVVVREARSAVSVSPSPAAQGRTTGALEGGPSRKPAIEDRAATSKKAASNIRIVDVAQGGAEERPAAKHPAKFVKAAAKAGEAEAKPVVRLVETPQAHGAGAAVKAKAPAPGPVLAAVPVEDDHTPEPKPGEDPRHQLALQPILRLSDAAPVFYEAMASENVLMDDPAAAPEDLANVLVVRSMSVIDQFRSGGSDASLFCNVSMTMLRRKEFLTRFMECLESRRDLAGQLVLEFHQSELSGGADEEMLRGIQSAGFSFSMDDVTDWEEDIERLSDIGFRFIKVNASDFTAQIKTEAKAESLLAVLRDLSLQLIVENVDASVQREAVMAVGAPFAQGLAIDEAKLVRLD